MSEVIQVHRSAAVEINTRKTASAGRPPRRSLPEILAERLEPIPEAALDELPPRNWLIDNVLPADVVVALYGEYGVGKSFLALAWACCLASELQSWNGLTTDTGPVVYVAAEGLAGIRVRRLAWKLTTHVRDLPGLFFIREAADLRNAEAVDVLVDQIVPIAPKLIVIDTLARCLPGGNEEGTADMGALIESCDQLRRATGATILLVHHPTKSKKETMRGNGVLHAALDTIMRLDRVGEYGLRLTCGKQKDAKEFGEITLKRVVVELPNGETSCSIKGPGESGSKYSSPELNPTEQVAIAALSRLPGRHGSAEWLTETKRLAAKSGLSQSNFYKVISKLVSAALVMKSGSGQGARYELTERGTTAASELPIDYHGSAAAATAIAPAPPLGGGE